MKISEKIKHVFRRRPPTEADLAARAEADVARAQKSIDRGNADVASQAGRTSVPPGF
jgi:hypothetical protein